MEFSEVLTQPFDLWQPLSLKILGALFLSKPIFASQYETQRIKHILKRVLTAKPDCYLLFFDLTYPVFSH